MDKVANRRIEKVIRKKQSESNKYIRAMFGVSVILAIDGAVIVVMEIQSTPVSEPVSFGLISGFVTMFTGAIGIIHRAKKYQS